MPETSLFAFISHSDAVGLLVLAVLAVMSAACWYQTLVKLWEGRYQRRLGAAFQERFVQVNSLPALARLMQGEFPGEGRARLVAASLAACAQLAANRQHLAAGRQLHAINDSDEYLRRALQRVLAEEESRREAGLTVLASVGACAPFVGLFGTVWGIYHALLGLGQGAQATLDRVAGPVGEALIMTAAGLAVAIPAVLLYNFLVRANRAAQDELDGFAHDLWVFLGTESHPDPTPPRPFPAAPALRPEAV